MNTDKHRCRSRSVVSLAYSVHIRRRFLRISVSICVHLWLISLCLFALHGNVEAQIRSVYDQGALGLGQLLKRLNTTASALMIGAHPDDEDTALLAYLARGESARTAYLSLTRGDGGQNIIGPELGESLGVIRTEELLQARKLDGAEQYFTRAYDYGFSKTLDEAKQKWDEKIILCDAVRVIRNFRPLVVISQFSGTSADGHGHHQYSGYITPLAIKAAADPAQCSDSGPAWQVRKFYVRHGFRATGEPKLSINTGKYDPLLGRSYFEIAMEARSQHKSQEQGVLELRGDQFSGLNLVGSDAKENGIFDGLDVSISGAAKNTGNSERPFAEKLKRLQEMAAKALAEYNVREPEQILGSLVEGYKLAHEAEWSTRIPASKAAMQRKQAEFLDAIKLAAGIRIDILADKETVVPGEKFTATANVFFEPSTNVKVKNIVIKTPNTWMVSPAQPPPAPTTGFFRREAANHSSYFDVMVAANETPTRPYWLNEPREGDLFRWPDNSTKTLPFGEPEVSGELKIDVGGEELTFIQPVEYRFADDTRGEIRRPLQVVSRVALSLDQDLLVVDRRDRLSERKMTVTVMNNSTEKVAGEIHLTPPKDGTIRDNGMNFILARKGERTSFPFTVEFPANTPAGKRQMVAVAMINNTQLHDSMRTISYPHIQTHRTYGAAIASVEVVDLEVGSVKVGYIAGSGDKIPQAVGQIGLDLTVIDERTLASGDLNQFDVIVIGIRAYQVRPDLAANNKRLLDFANSGGTLIVQYQLPGYAQQNLMPFPAQMGPRVADENAKVTILQPEHPIFNFPNRITQEDFKGWVQERNLYNFSTMDERYVGLLESHDPDEAENKGGLVAADVGKGKYIYCSYSLFRQLPAGVPGAYRLFANMLSLGAVRK